MSHCDFHDLWCASCGELINATLEERGKSYGDFDSQALLSQALKRVMHDGDNWNVLQSFQKEALEMIQLKIARILNGDPDFADSWHDISGYAKLVEDRLQK